MIASLKPYPVYRKSMMKKTVEERKRPGTPSAKTPGNSMNGVRIWPIT
jgi:hypothetical protein